jgi:hypothetical protein
MSEKIALVLEATKPTQPDRVELFKIGRSLVGPRVTHSTLEALVNDACGVAYVPSIEFSMNLTIKQVLMKAHNDAQIDRILTLRKLISDKLQEMM